jgi:ketosteroid isomerase-like protein
MGKRLFTDTWQTKHLFIFNSHGLRYFRRKEVERMKLYVILGAWLMLACQTKVEEWDLRDQVMETDRKFSQMAAEKGNSEAFIYFADEMVIKMQTNDYPIVGKYALMKVLKETPWDDFNLSWEPLRAEASGNLGYTFGNYKLETKTSDGLRDTVIYGNYVSVWKRKKDGSWRYIVDGGNDTPGPVSLKQEKQ